MSAEDGGPATKVVQHGRGHGGRGRLPVAVAAPPGPAAAGPGLESYILEEAARIQGRTPEALWDSENSVYADVVRGRGPKRCSPETPGTSVRAAIDICRLLNALLFVRCPPMFIWRRFGRRFLSHALARHTYFLSWSGPHDDRNWIQGVPTVLHSGHALLRYRLLRLG